MCGQPDQAGIWVSDADLSGRAREKKITNMRLQVG